MSTTETWTVGRLLTWTADFLKQQGSSSPRLDAEILLAHASKCERIELYTAFSDEASEEVRTAFREMVRRRAEGTPVAYLVGYKEFYSEKFEVNPDVLIPRPETEHLVIEALDRAKVMQEQAPDKHLHIADVGTGSGIVALTLAREIATAQVDAIDVSEAALEIAKRNAVNLGIDEKRVRFLRSDLLEACEPESKYDLIVSNPPYVSEAEYNELETTVREFEPKQALVAGPKGSEVIHRLIAQSQHRLAPQGWLIFEFSPMLEDEIKHIDAPEWNMPLISKDLAGHARIVAMQLKN